MTLGFHVTTDASNTDSLIPELEDQTASQLLSTILFCLGRSLIFSETLWDCTSTLRAYVRSAGSNTALSVTPGARLASPTKEKFEVRGDLNRNTERLAFSTLRIN